MTQYIDKAAIVAEIEKQMQVHHSGYLMCLKNILSFLDTLEVKEVDLKKEARNYLFNEHVSPLNDILHHCDLKTEVQYHKDLENAFKAGFGLGLNVQNYESKNEDFRKEMEE